MVVEKLRIVPSSFGNRYAVEDVVSRASAIVVGWRTASEGFQPRYVCLPHQLYTEKVRIWRANGAKDVSFAEVVTPWTEVPE